MDNFRTIKAEGNHEIIINKSRFICSMKRTDSEAEAQQFIADIKAEHPKANHNCFAYLIGNTNSIQRMSDDGEPSGTAGVPMLEVLKKQQLKNITAVVTRYFGGVKLGAGGLIRAYGSSVSEALNAIGLVEKQMNQLVSIDTSYHLSGKLQNTLAQSSYLIQSIDYTDTVLFHCIVKVEDIEQFKLDVTNWTSAQAVITLGDKAWMEMDITD
ncbi:MAG: YigZ family protein [Alkalibacterium sp.]|nr:YigZ family protein [Alkalibacterium sp.]TVP90650.1 MAG: YigZ family protein [Alkalibacterium sp.]